MQTSNHHKDPVTTCQKKFLLAEGGLLANILSCWLLNCCFECRFVLLPFCLIGFLSVLGIFFIQYCYFQIGQHVVLWHTQIVYFTWCPWKFSLSGRLNILSLRDSEWLGLLSCGISEGEWGGRSDVRGPGSKILSNISKEFGQHWYKISLSKGHDSFNVLA